MVRTKIILCRFIVYLLSDLSVAFKLKRFWLLLIAAGLMLILTTLELTSWQDCLAGALPYVGGGVIGFASSAFFSRQDQFLLRGLTNTVYLVSQPICCPNVYALANRETKNALGGVGREISSVSQCLVEQLYRKEQRLNLRDAHLRQLDGEECVFAILSEVGFRYAIPDPETRTAIWADKPSILISEKNIAKLDQWYPGNDLISVYCWPENERKRTANAQP